MQHQLDELWQGVLGEMEVELSSANFNTWFKGTKIGSIENGRVVVAVPSNFYIEWLRKNYHSHILKILRKFDSSILSIEYHIVSQQPQLELALSKQTANSKQQTTNEPQPTTSGARPFPLKRDLTFNNFVVGPHNRLAHATSLAVAQNPGKTHNPLFIYGGVGLGKTHLICAIGNSVTEQFPNKKILYASCEDFANEYITSIQTKKTEEFKKKYRSVDIFLIDDIQFLSNKEGTQEEFFHTYNHLHQNNAQIVMTSDRIPRAIPDLESRLSSRFSAGMVADISSPNFETRQAILRAKCQDKGWQLDPEIIEFIAAAITANIRELEGALNRVMVFCEVNKTAPTLDLARLALENFVALGQQASATPEKVLKAVGQFFNLTLQELLSPKRNREIVVPRQIAMYILRSDLAMTYPQIGKFLGGKDHTTIMHGYDVINREIARGNQLKEQIKIIKERIHIL